MSSKESIHGTSTTRGTKIFKEKFNRAEILTKFIPSHRLYAPKVSSQSFQSSGFSKKNEVFQVFDGFDPQKLFQT